MRLVIIGGTGHIGTYLTPRLVEAGYEVINITRGQSQPYLPHPAWKQVRSVVADREAEDAAGTFGGRVRDLKPDVVIDLVCFTLASAQHIVQALKGQIQHFLHCGTMWVHGYPVQQPTTEDAPRKPFPPYNFNVTDIDAYLSSDYGRQKAAIEAYLLDEARRYGFPATVLHPGHIVGPGHNPINPQGNAHPRVFEQLAKGEELILPNLGLETVHHVHADDVAQSFMLALHNWSASVGEAFHVVSPAALTLRGYAEAVAGWFGQEAQLKFLGWDDFTRAIPARQWTQTWDHIAHSPNGSIAKAQRRLGYQPRYTSLQAVHEAVMWMVDHDFIRV
jgi:nucleoside-diphosphate-sugar epimerase